MAPSAVPRPSRLAAWRDLAAGLGIPVLVSAMLPSPTTLLSDLNDPQPWVAVGAALLGVTAALAWALTAWGAVVVATALVGAVPHQCGHAAQRLLRRIAPAAVRRTAALAVGLSLTVGIALPAHAGPAATAAGSDATPPAAQAGTTLPGSGELLIIDLDWGAAPAASTFEPPPGPSTREPTIEPPAATAIRTVTVQPGDCLWALAAGELPSSATAAEIDAAWRAWYRTNRDVIGADPNILVPGQRLAVPAAVAAPAAASTPLSGGIR